MPLDRRNALCRRRETVYGTDPGVALATDAMDVTSWSITDDAQMYGRHVRSLYLQPGRASTIGQRLWRVSCTEYIRGNSAALAAAVFPQIDAPLVSAGYTSAFGALTHTYTPSYDLCGSSTWLGYRDGILYTVKGVRGDASFQFTPGAPGTMSFNGVGLWTAPTDTALTNPAYTAEPSNPPICKELFFKPYTDAPTIAQYGHVHNVSINLRMQTEVIGSASLATTSLGVDRVLNTGAGAVDDPGIEVVFDVEQPVTAEINPDTEWWDRFAAREISAACSITLGTAASNTFNFNIARLFCQSVAPIVLKGMPGFHVVARALGSAAAVGEDSLKIVST